MSKKTATKTKGESKHSLEPSKSQRRLHSHTGIMLLQMKAWRRQGRLDPGRPSGNITSLTPQQGTCHQGYILLRDKNSHCEIVRAITKLENWKRQVTTNVQGDFGIGMAIYRCKHIVHGVGLPACWGSAPHQLTALPIQAKWACLLIFSLLGLF